MKKQTKKMDKQKKQWNREASNSALAWWSISIAHSAGNRANSRPPPHHVIIQQTQYIAATSGLPMPLKAVLMVVRENFVADSCLTSGSVWSFANPCIRRWKQNGCHRKRSSIHLTTLSDSLLSDERGLRSVRRRLERLDFALGGMDAIVRSAIGWGTR